MLHKFAHSSTPRYKAGYLFERCYFGDIMGSPKISTIKCYTVLLKPTREKNSNCFRGFGYLYLYLFNFSMLLALQKDVILYLKKLKHLLLNM